MIVTPAHIDRRMQGGSELTVFGVSATPRTRRDWMLGCRPAPNENALRVGFGGVESLPHPIIPRLDVARGLVVIAEATFDLIVGDELIFEVIGQAEQGVAFVLDQPVGVVSSGERVHIDGLASLADLTGNALVNAPGAAVADDGVDGVRLRRWARCGRIGHG